MHRVALLAILFASGVCSSEAHAQFRRNRPAPAVAASGIRDYPSRNFLVHTDLAPQEAADLLRRLETMLGIISKYWGQPNRQTIECYVVKDLANWSQGAIPANALENLRNGGGLTMTTGTTLGGRLVQSKSVVYAIADHGTPQHEAVHAYCGQNFGSTGPTWYAEGMAEMGNYWVEGETAVNLPEPVLNHLQNSDPKPLLAIVDNTDQTGDSWQNYAWRWALCNLLAYNPNYATRFRPLGLNLIVGRPDSFQRTYGAMSQEVAFEYRFFLEHLENGLRADLIAWDWKTPFRPLTRGRSSTATIAADRGWQASRLTVEAGITYTLEATGTWTLENGAAPLTATGSENGRGRLVGIIQNPDTYTLGEPFELGESATFTPDVAGKLYLRCSDGWGDLADNAGKLTVKLERAE